MNLWDKKCWCGNEVKSPMRKYCRVEHSRWWFYYIRSYWGAFRREILRRDNYTCQECGYTPDKKYGRDGYFDVDHELAIINGGMCFDTENVRTICHSCHKKKTKKDMIQRKLRRMKLQPLENFIVN